MWSTVTDRFGADDHTHSLTDRHADVVGVLLVSVSQHTATRQRDRLTTQLWQNDLHEFHFKINTANIVRPIAWCCHLANLMTWSYRSTVRLFRSIKVKRRKKEECNKDYMRQLGDLWWLFVRKTYFLSYMIVARFLCESRTSCFVTTRIGTWTKSRESKRGQIGRYLPTVEVFLARLCVERVDSCVQCP